MAIFRVGSKWLAYGVEVPDDHDQPALLWSLVEREEELSALRALVDDPRCTVFLFNEAVVPVAWVNAELDLAAIGAAALFDGIVLADANDPEPTYAVKKYFEEAERDFWTSADCLYAEAPPFVAWNGIHSTYITNNASRSSLSIFDGDEGGQQEEIGVWLTDGLQFRGTIKGPKIRRNGKVRELTDLLLSHDYGAFLIESKTLNIGRRDPLPSRAELAADLRNDLLKATRQLKGALRWMREGHLITDAAGAELVVEREAPAHVIVLVPDLKLLSEATEFGGQFVAKTLEESNAFLHFLDPAELLRMVQAAGQIERTGKTKTRLMAFDWYLMERAKRAVQCETPCFGVLLRTSNNTYADVS